MLKYINFQPLNNLETSHKLSSYHDSLIEITESLDLSKLLKLYGSTGPIEVLNKFVALALVNLCQGYKLN